MAHLRTRLRSPAAKSLAALCAKGVSKSRGSRTSNHRFVEYAVAVVPDESETLGDVFRRIPPHPSAPQLQPDADGFLWLTVEAFRGAFAPDATASETALMAATQKPISMKCLGEKMTRPAWKEKPSWFLIAEKDIMLSPETQRFTAARMKSKIVSSPVDHHPLASKPDAVTDLIIVAARAV